MIIKPTAVNQGDLYNLLQALVNRVFGNPALAIATTTTDIKTTNAVYFCIAGQLYTLGASDNQALTGLSNTSATQYRKVRVEVNTSGTISFKEGAAAASQDAAPMPRRSASKATLGWIEIPASFTIDTSLFNVAGVAFYNGDPDLGPGSGLPPNDRGISQTVIN